MNEAIINPRFHAISCFFLVYLAAFPLLAEELPARLDWGKRVELGLPVSGRVDKVEVTAGSQVKAGQALLNLELAPFRARLEAAQGWVKAVAALQAEADRELARTQALYEQTLISAHELEIARNAALSAAAEAGKAQGEAVAAKSELDYAQLRAPFAGLVVARRVEPGQAVVSRCQAVALLILADNRTLSARAQVPAQRLEGLRVGQKLDITVAGQSYPGTISALGFEPLNETPEYSLEVSFQPAENSGLRAGMAAGIVLP
jgi:RND family efflux transporter MFP subunit